MHMRAHGSAILVYTLSLIIFSFIGDFPCTHAYPNRRNLVRERFVRHGSLGLRLRLLLIVRLPVCVRAREGVAKRMSKGR